MKKKVLITGGSGLIGQRMLSFLPENEYEVRILSRNKSKVQRLSNYFYWDTSRLELDPNALEGIDYIINLAGAGIADKRWTSNRKNLILSSRVNSIKTLAANKHLISKECVFIGASAVGYYGDRGPEILKENSSLGEGFLSEVTNQWEQATADFANFFRRSVILRIGIVLSTQGGALKEMLKPAKFGMYSHFGNGQAFYPWIHIDDLCHILKESIQSELYSGVLNATAPEPVSIKNLVNTLKDVMPGFGIQLGVPAWILKMALGEMSTMLTGSMRAIPSKLMEMNHKFIHPNLKEALQDIIQHKV